MSNRFINKVGVAPLGTAPQLARADIQPENIAKAVSTGNQLNDIILDTAIKYSKGLDEMKRNNEIAKSKVDLQKSIQDYELSWEQKDRFSDENYADYKAGLENIYEEARLNFANTKYTRESDVLSWDTQIDDSKNVAIYKTEGARADYEVKKYTDETITNANSLFELYKQTGDESLKAEALKLYDNLTSVGVPQYKVDDLKIKQAIGSDKAMLEIKANAIINDPKLSLQEKRQQIADLQSNLMNDNVYKTATQMAIDEGLISNEYAEAYSKQLKATYHSAFLGNNGLINKLNTEIRNEEYRVQTTLENERLRQENAKLKATNNVINAYKSGNDYKLISTVEGREITPYELVDNQDLSVRYYGKTPQEILDNSQFIPTKSIYEINDIKNKSKVDEQNGINRNLVVENIYNNMQSSSDSDNEFKNSKTEMVYNGVITQFEADVMDDTATFNEPKADIINYAHTGYNNSRFNKMQGFIGLSSTSALNQKLEGLDNNQRQKVSEVITGAILNNKFGGSFNAKELTIGTINQQYNSVPEFREFVDDVINGVKQVKPTKYSKAMLIKNGNDYAKEVEDKYNKDIKIRRATFEKGTTPYVERYNENIYD